MQLFVTLLSLFTLAAKRLWNHRLLMLCLLVGLITAVSLLSSVPLYTDAVYNNLLKGELTEAGTYRPPFAFLWRYIGAWNGDISWNDYQPINQYLSEQASGIVDLPLGETDQIRHVSTAKLRLFPAEAGQFDEDALLMWASVGFVSRLQEHVQLIEGHFPGESGESVEVMVSQKTAESLGIQSGETYTLLAADGGQIPVRVVGVWQAIDASEPFWFYQPDAFDELLLTTEAAFATGVVSQLEKPVSTAVWYQLYDGSRVGSSAVADLLAGVTVVEARATALLNGTTLDASPVAALQTFNESADLLRFILTIFSIPVVGLVLYFISLIANMVVQRSQSEIAILRSRGMGRGQIVAVYLLEGALIGGLGLVGGLEFGRFLAQLMGRTRTFLDPMIWTQINADEQGLVVGVSETAVWYALVAIGLSILALLLPALWLSRHTIITLRWQQARALLRPAWQRYFLDVFLLIPPLYGWYQLNQQGSIALLGSSNDPFANPLLFLVPILFCFSLALFAVRFFPWVMGVLAWLAGWLPGTTLLLTLRELARSAAQYTGPLLLLSFTLSMATFTASMAVTLDNHLHAQVYYQVGADLNLAELGENTEEPDQPTLPGQEETETEDESEEEEPRWLFLPVTDHLLVQGVKAAARVGEYTATSNIGGRQQTGRILGIDRVDFAQVAYYRPDFASNESLGGLMNRLAVDRTAVLVSRDFMTRHTLQVGDPLRLTVGAAGEFAEMEFTIAGPLDLFPTQYPQDGPFFVANLDYLHDGLGGTFPYNVWLATEAAVSSQSIMDGVRDLGLVVTTASDARANITAEQTRPERQGLFGLLSVGFLSSAVLTVLGFLVYAVVSFQRRFIQLGMLRAIGLSISQMAAYLAGEQAALILTGIGLGAGLGVWASTLFIPFLQVGSDKTARIPPYVVQIAWEQIGTIFSVFGAMFVVAVVVLILLLIRMKVFEAVKLGETV